jgi:anaerobic ribonucleoside-triphosphate reductase
VSYTAATAAITGVGIILEQKQPEIWQNIWTKKWGGLGYQSGPEVQLISLCPKCQYVNKKNRNKNQFECLQCGYKDMADYVAAINIYTHLFVGTQNFQRI